MVRRRAAPQSYPIRAVARMTGLSVDTLRAWERRYEAVVPGRGARGRMYSGEDVDRLRQLATLVERGHPIGTVANLSVPQLTWLIDTSDTQSASPDAPAAADLTTIFRPLDHYDLPAIESALARHAAVLPTPDLIFALILPLLRELGDRWQAGMLSPAQEHLVSASIRTVLGGLLRAIARPDATPRIVFATLPGERHELGLLCAALLVATAGYGVVYLGTDLPEQDVARAVIATKARVLVLSATTPPAETSTAVRHLVRLIEGTELWIGGPQAPTLVAAAGGRGRAVDSLEDVVKMLSRHAS